MNEQSFINNAECALIREAVLLPMVLKIVEKNQHTLQQEKMSMKRLYLVATEILIGRIHGELAQVKKELWKQQIRVVTPNSEEILGYAFACRGMSSQVVMTREEVNTEVAARLSKFIDGLSQEFLT